MQKPFLRSKANNWERLIVLSPIPRSFELRRQTGFCELGMKVQSEARACNSKLCLESRLFERHTKEGRVFGPDIGSGQIRYRVSRLHGRALKVRSKDDVLQDWTTPCFTVFDSGLLRGCLRTSCPIWDLCLDNCFCFLGE